MNYNPVYTKKIYDAVHGFIRFNELEQELIDSEPFQRLHYLHQLGISFLVYPGATHTRFEHSLGAMELTTQIFNRIITKFDLSSAAEEIDIDYWRQILRLAALCHDLGHLPFSHVAEKVLLGKGGHERWTLAVIECDQLKPVWDRLQQRYPKRSVIDDLVKMALGPKKIEEIGSDLQFSAWEKVMTEVITGDFFGADRIDYLLRDAQCTGVSYGLFDYHQLIEMLCILPQKGGLSLGIEENGIESCEALLLARHFMHQRVYQYASSKAYSFHLARFMKEFYTEGRYLESLGEYLSMTDNEILAALRKAASHKNELGHADARALLMRHNRFSAVELQKGVGEKNLKTLQELLNIASDSISWNLLQEKEENQGLTFPVLKRSGAIIESSECSQIAIPRGGKSWVFIAPHHEKMLREALES